MIYSNVNNLNSYKFSALIKLYIKMMTSTFLEWNAKHCKQFFIIAIVWVISFTTSLADEGRIITVTYYSTTQSDSCNMNIYLPAGYDEPANSDVNYPAFYIMHGYGEDYEYWGRQGKADTVLNYYISNEIAVPMILVMPDGRNLSPEIFSNEMLNDIIPYIESNYRIIADKDHRGMGGLSWGGAQSLEVGILHYDMFGYLAIMSSGYFTEDNYNEARALLETDAVEMEQSIRYFYFAQGTKYDQTYEIGMVALHMFRDYGLTVHYWEFSGGHQWEVWREDFKSFTPYLFRDTTTRYISLEFQGGIIKNSTIMTYRDSLAPAPPDPTREGYSFAGWYTEPECIDSFNFSTDTIKRNITLYANWSINSYKVSFNSHGGDYTPDTITAVYNTLIEEPVEPQKAGLYFGGWYKDTLFIDKWDFTLSRVKQDITLHAKWSDVTSIHENHKSSIIVFPNPSQSYFQIGNLQSDADIDIFGIEGNVLIHKEGINSSSHIDIENIPKGIYTIIVYGTNENYHLKFIKQ